MTATMNDLFTPLQRMATSQLPGHQPRGHQARGQSSRPFTSFYIKDILGSKIDSNNKHDKSHGEKINQDNNSSTGLFGKRGESTPTRPRVLSHQRHERHERSSSEETRVPVQVKSARDAGDSPLSALEELANKTFTGPDTSILRAAEAATATGKREALTLLNRQQPRKKRKSRTAFSNHQIFELERRFLYQKYLTPADRDELASTLGLSNAQVITWFQNRRAKLKRDIDELKNDVRATSTTPVHNTTTMKAEDHMFMPSTESTSLYDHGEEECYTEDSSSELMSPFDHRRITGCYDHGDGMGTAIAGENDNDSDSDNMSVHYADSDSEENARMSISKSSPSPAQSDDLIVDDDDYDLDPSDIRVQRTE